ncbi:MAG: PorV/PorQ family protein [Endomicrobia bacterium]|nr:PorV/PorQ family protein [Endomicrobiia bacterium]
MNKSIWTSFLRLCPGHALLALLAMTAVFVFPGFSYAASTSGTTPVPFLKYGAGARAAGMGSAFSAVAGGGADMIYWNPAGIASITKKEASLMYLSGLEGVSYGWASYAMPALYGSFGAAVQYMSSGDIEGTGIFGESTSNFSTYDLAVSLSYARYLDFENAGALDYGVNIKYIYSKIDNSASAFAVDAGVIFTLNDNATSFGAVMQNAGTSLKYNEENEVLPFVARFGASRLFFEKLLIVFDLNIPNDNDVFPSFGAEYSINIMPEADIAIRAGYDGRQKDIDGFSRVNAGFGLKYTDYMFDYAFSPYGDLGNVHRVSLGILFGKEFDEEKALKEKSERKEAKEEKERIRKAKEAAGLEKQKQEEAEAGRPQDLDENYNRTDFSEYEEEFAARPVRSNIQSVAVVNFISSNVPKNELGVYSEMLRKNLYETGSFSSADVSKIDNIYSGNKLPESGDIYNIFKFAKVKKVIVCDISKKGGNLSFDLTVYDEKLNGKKYNITSKDSFRFANEALKQFADKLAEEIE